MITQQLLLAGGTHLGNDSFTKILLHMDGTNGSTTFTDSNLGGSANTWTATGDAQITTVASKFGGAAGQFSNNTNSCIRTNDSASFTLGAGEFTVDFWFNTNGAGNGTDRLMWGQGNSTANGGFTAYGALTTANVIYGAVSTNGTAEAARITSTSTFTAAGWHHYAFVRTVNTLKLFIDGTQQGGDVAYSGTMTDSANKFGIATIGEYGASVGSLLYPGYIDEFRLSVGIARWTSNFTPSTIAYF